MLFNSSTCECIADNVEGIWSYENTSFNFVKYTKCISLTHSFNGIKNSFKQKIPKQNFLV